MSGPVHHKGPYPPKHQGAGGVPSVIPDVPVSAVLLFIFICLAVGHMGIFIKNKKRGILFVFNGASFGLCNIRLITFSLRMAWSTHPRNLNLAIATGVFTNAGAIILFAVNSFFAQRIVRAQHQKIGWSKPISLMPTVAIFFLVTTLVMIVVAVVQSFFALNPGRLGIDRQLELYGQTVFMIIAFLPIPVVGISTLAGQLPSVKARRQVTPVDKFGRGRLRHKVMLCLFSASMCCIEEGYRCGTLWMPPAPSEEPLRWYFTKAAFYMFNFIPEVSVLTAFLVFRIDHMFLVPNKAKGGYGRHADVEHASVAEEEMPATEKPAGTAEEKGTGSDTDEAFSP